MSCARPRGPQAQPHRSSSFHYLPRCSSSSFSGQYGVQRNRGQLIAVPSATAETAPTQRDRHLELTTEKGRMGWQTASGYTKRARAEATIGRWKRVIGDGLRSHTDERRATEMDVAVHVLNRMLELGRPSYVRIA